MNVVTMGMRNAFRNTIRTASLTAILGLSIGLSLVMLISYQTVNRKIQTTKEALGNSVAIKPAGYSSFSQVNRTLSQKQVDKIKKIDHVADVTATLNDQLTSEGVSQPAGLGQPSTAKTSLTSAIKLSKGNNGGMNTLSGGGLMLAGNGKLPDNISLPVAIVGSSNPASARGLEGATSLDITAGKQIAADKDSNDAMISTSLAKKNNLTVGSKFTAYDETFTVRAIYDTHTESGNNTVVVSLPTLQRLMDKKDTITSVTASVDSLDNLNTATNAIKKALGSSADVTSSTDQANQALQPLAGVKKISFFSLIGSAVASGMIIFTTMVMIVRERKREIGILKAIGASSARIILQFASEALTFAMLGIMVGALVGTVAGGPVTSSLVGNSVKAATAPGAPQTVSNLSNPFFQNVNSLHANVSTSVMLYGICVVFIITILSSSCAGWLVARVKPAEALRQD